MSHLEPVYAGARKRDCMPHKTMNELQPAISTAALHESLKWYLNDQKSPPQFGGEKSDQYNSMYDALILAAADYQLSLPAEIRVDDTKAALYQFVEETPAGSLVVEIVNSLNRLGKRIVDVKDCLV